jgi:outer membrane protein assembly factor BamB
MNRRHQVLASIIIVTISCILFLSYLLHSHLEQLSLDNTSIDKSTIDSLGTLPIPPPLPNPYKATFVESDTSEYSIEVLNASFLHNTMRNYYGDSTPSKLDVLWKLHLGTGTTKVGTSVLTWAGAGWTGQPLIVVENGKKFLIQGAYDHHLKKIDAETGKIVWQYKYDDVIKGTGTIWINHNANSLKNFCVILQGSRAGKSNYSTIIPSYRAISYFTGEELWRLNSTKTSSYSRDVDASALIIKDTAYIGLENSIFTIFNPNPDSATIRKKILQPKIHKNTDTLYLKKDKKLHGGNLVTEASPTLLGNRIYIASGSGHIWGYNLITKKIDWDYFIGSDIDGSPVVTDDSCLLITIEKQYIEGQGGVLKLNPRKAPKDAAEWFFPTQNIIYSSWLGGIIGSASVNYHYKKEGHPSIAAFTAIDGFMYVVDTRNLDTLSKSPTFNPSLLLPKPKLLFKYKTGTSISTPIIVQNKIIAATYSGIYLFEFDADMNFELKEKANIRCEATPVVDHGRIYIASRNGFLYCLGEKNTTDITPRRLLK